MKKLSTYILEKYKLSKNTLDVARTEYYVVIPFMQKPFDYCMNNHNAIYGKEKAGDSYVIFLLTKEDISFLYEQFEGDKIDNEEDFWWLYEMPKYIDKKELKKEIESYKIYVDDLKQIHYEDIK